MYRIGHYSEKDSQRILQFIEKNPFAFLSGCDALKKPVATQLPLFFETIKGKRVLRGHMMKNTDHHKAMVHNPQVLVVFSGKHTYVSGTWYSQAHTPSTWNYMSVQLQGRMHFLDDEALAEILQASSLYFEGANTQSSTVFSNLDANYKQKVMGAIVGFQIEIENMEAVFKLSQDRDAESYQNIIRQLELKDEAAREIAHEMEKRLSSLFPKN